VTGADPDTNRTSTRGPNPSQPETSQVRRITWVGLVANVLLSAFKMTVGILGLSQAVVADAVHSMSDIVTDVAVLVGVRYWSPPPDECHPYGHRRIESIVTVGIGAGLGLVGMMIAYKGIASVRDEHIEQPHWIAFTGAAVSIVTKEVLYHWTYHVGRRIRSSALCANAWHHRSDALSSVPAALAVAVAALRPELSFVDHIGAVVVAIFILHASGKIMKPALAELSDHGAPGEVIMAIRRIAAATDDVVDVHAVRTRRMGPGILVDLHITVEGSMSVTRGHDVSEAVKKRIKAQIEDVIDVVVHLEPDTVLE
jgi:cation diffusion facilitator family transporter